MDVSDLGRRIVERAQRGARGDAIPTPDLGSFRAVGRRTRVMRLGLAAVLVGGTLLTLALVPSADDRRFLPASNVGIVVLDVSTSVKPSTYDLIREQLEGAVVHVSPVRRRPLLGRRLRGPPAGDTGTRATQVRPLLPPGLPLRQGRQSPPALAVGAVVLGRHVDLVRPTARRASCSRSVPTPTAGSS